MKENKMEESKLEKAIQEIEEMMDDSTVEQFENLYMLIVGKLSGKSAAEDLWPRYQELYDNSTQPETAVVSMVGNENGFPGIWSMLRAMTVYMAYSRNGAARGAASAFRPIEWVDFVALSTAIRDMAREAVRVIDAISDDTITVMENVETSCIELHTSTGDVLPVTIETLEEFAIRDYHVALSLNVQGSKRALRLAFLSPAELAGNAEGLESNVEFRKVVS